jgi:hypothetical protein
MGRVFELASRSRAKWAITPVPALVTVIDGRVWWPSALSREQLAASQLFPAGCGLV